MEGNILYGLCYMPHTQGKTFMMVGVDSAIRTENKLSSINSEEPQGNKGPQKSYNRVRVQAQRRITESVRH